MNFLRTAEQARIAKKVVSKLEDKYNGKICTCLHHRKHHITTELGPHRGGCKKCECSCWEVTTATPEEVERMKVGIDHILIYHWAEEGRDGHAAEVVPRAEDGVVGNGRKRDAGAGLGAIMAFPSRKK